MTANDFSAKQIQAQVAQRLGRLQAELEGDLKELAEFAADRNRIDLAPGLEALSEAVDAASKLSGVLATDFSSPGNI
jgi:hypothetical protein